MEEKNFRGALSPERVTEANAQAIEHVHSLVQELKTVNEYEAAVLTTLRSLCQNVEITYAGSTTAEPELLACQPAKAGGS